MATCGSLHHIFEKPLPESPPTLLESLSPWKQIKSVKTIEDSSYTEIFGELHFKEHHVESASPSSPLPQSYHQTSPMSSLSFFAEVQPQSSIDKFDKENSESSPSKNETERSPTTSYCPTRQYRDSDSFSSMNSESLSLCTEGLGFESSDDVEDLTNEASFDFQNHEEKTQSFSRHAQSENYCKELSKRSRTNKGSFPPPISCIGRSGKPWVCFKSYREDGRFILQEIRFPSQEFLHACREDGRLRLQFIQPDDEVLEEDDQEEEEEEDDNTEEVEEANKETKSADKEDQDHVAIEGHRCNDAEKRCLEYHH